MKNPFKRAGMPPSVPGGDKMFHTSGEDLRQAKDLSEEGYTPARNLTRMAGRLKGLELFFADKDVEETAFGYVFDEARDEVSGTQVPLYDLMGSLEGKIDCDVVKGQVLTGENLETKGEFQPGYMSDKITWREYDGQK